MTSEGMTQRLGELRIDRRVIRRRRWLLRLIPAALLFVLGLGLLFHYARRPPEVELAQVRQARPGEAQTELSAAGYVASRRRSIVAPKVPGRLDEVLVEEGQKVQEGQVLARLDPEDAQVAFERAGAEAAAARASLIAAEAELARWERELKRTEALVRGGAVARRDLDDMRTQRDAAVAQTNAARARVAASNKAAAAAELNLESTVVKAPFTGTVVRKIADEGAVLAPATIAETDVGGIVELVDLSDLEVEAEVAEDDLARITLGQPTLIFLDAQPGKVWRGQAESIRPAIDRSKGTGVVKVRFLDPPTGVLPDMAARVAFLEKPVDPGSLAREPRLRVPASAVVEREGKPVVLTIEGGRVDAVPVDPGPRVGDELVLTRGPRPRTEVVKAPGPGLHSGERVRIRQEGGK